jgi:hypothetical protein
MDLNPVQIEDLYDSTLLESFYSQLNRKKEIVENPFYKESLYSDPKLDSYFNQIKEKTLKKLIENVLIACETNDIYQMHHLICQLKEVRFSNNISIEYAEEILLILDKYVRKNYKDFNFVNDIMSLMLDLVSMKNLKIQIDWKVYYQLFLMIYGISKYEFAMNYSEKYLKDIHLCEFIKKAHRLFYFTEEDYKFLKEEINKRLVFVSGQMVLGLLISQLFLPAKFFEKDKELQEKYFLILQNKMPLATYVLLNFSKINSTPESLLIDKEKFIDIIFSLSYASQTDGLPMTYFNWPDTVNKDKNSTVPVCFILANFIIHPAYQIYKEKVDRNLKIFVNLISSNLTENSCSDSVFSVVKLLLRNIKQLSSSLTEYEVSEYDFYSEFTLQDENKQRIKEIRKMFHPIISKCFMYNDSSTFSVLIEFLALSDDKILHEEFNDIIFHLFENSHNDFDFFIKKITIFLRCFIENINDKKIYGYLIEIIDMSLNKISCVSGQINNSVLEFFNILITIVMHHPENKTNYLTHLVKLREKLDASCVIICRKIIQLFSVFASIVDELPYILFFYHMTKFISPTSADEINRMVLGFVKENSMKDSKEFSLMSYFLVFLWNKEGSKIDLNKQVWNYCYNCLVDTQNNKIKEITKDQLIYFKKLLPSIETFESIDTEEFINLIKLLLKEKDDKKKLAYILMRYFLYNVTLPYIKNEKVVYTSLENLKFVIRVWEEIIKPYEENINKYINEQLAQGEQIHSYQQFNEKISDSNNCENLTQIEETIRIFLRISVSYMLKCNNIFMREPEDALELLSLTKEFPEYPIYQQIIEIKNHLTQSTLKFHNFSKEKKIVEKNEKYFRRAYFAHLLEYDRFYHMRLISTYRKYMAYYTELEYKELSYIYLPIKLSSYYSHIKLFKIQEQVSDLNVVEQVFKCYIKTEDQTLIDHSLFKTSLILQNLIPDSKEAYEFFNKIIFDLVNKKLNKIPITKDNSVTDLKKFERIFDVLYSVISVYICKISDLSLLLNTLIHFRLLIDKYKFNIGSALENLTNLTKLVNYFIPKGTKLLDEKIKQLIPPYLYTKDDTLKEFEKINGFVKHDDYIPEIKYRIQKKKSELEFMSKENSKKLKNYIIETLDEEEKRFDSSNYLDSMNLMVDFLTTAILNLNLGTEEDRKIANRIEKYYYRKFFDESDNLKKRVFLTGLGIIANLRYKFDKKYVVNEIDNKISNNMYSFNTSSSLPEINFDDPNLKKNFTIKLSKFEKNYPKEIVDLFETQLSTEEGLTSLFENIYSIQKHKEHINALKSSGSGGVFDTIYKRLNYIFTPQFRDAYLGHERSYLITSLSDNPSVFNTQITRILFYIFYFSSFDNVDKLFEIYEKMKKEEKPLKNGIEKSEAQEHEIQQTEDGGDLGQGEENIQILNYSRHFSQNLQNVIHSQAIQLTQVSQETDSNTNVKSTEPKEKYHPVIITNVLMMILSGTIKKLKIEKKYDQISQILNRVMTYYTYNFNKRIDSEILNLFGSVLRILTPYEAQLILTDKATNSLFIYKYDDLMSMMIVDLIYQRFGSRTYLVFTKESIKEIERIIESTMKNQIEWVKYSFDFECTFIDYLYISKIIHMDNYKTYSTIYKGKELTELMEKNLDFFRKNQTKESLKLLNIIFREGFGYLITKPELFTEVLGEFTCYIRLDPQNYKKRIEYNVQQFQKFNKYVDIDFYTICDLLGKKMDEYKFSESFKFCTDCIKKLLIPRLNKVVVGYEIEGFNKLSQVVSVAKNADCRDYLCYFVLSYFIHALDEKTTLEIIKNVSKQIEKEKNEKNTKIVISLVTVLTSFLMDYEICLENYTEPLILKLKELNKTLFRNIGNESQIIKKSISRFYNKYSYTFEFVRRQVSVDCYNAIMELSKSHSYFI